MKKFDKEDLRVIASFVSLNLAFYSMALMSFADKAGNTAGLVCGFVGLIVFLNLALYGLIAPNLPKKIKR